MKPKPQATWTIPAELQLPDNLEAIERGRDPKLRQIELFGDNSVVARLPLDVISRRDAGTKKLIE